MTELPSIAYCGPIAQPGLPARGGYESANRRLIDDLRGSGLAVREYPYAPERHTLAGKTVGYAANFTGTEVRLPFQARGFDIFHITPLRRHFIFAEAILAFTAKARGRRLVIDLRAGCFVKSMQPPTSAIARVQAALLRAADLVAVEGLDYVDFVSRFTDKPVHYLPNYVSQPPVLGEPAPLEPGKPVRLVFLARVVPEKGIEVAIETVRRLGSMGIAAQLDVLGRADPNYQRRLDALAAGLPVVFRGAVKADDVRATVRGAHFFVFPTRHDGEGHSNALTETMAEGLVPICADNGFNRSIVADCGRICARDAEADAYAEAIAVIVSEGSWPELSRRTRARIAENYTADAVVPGLIERYRALVPGAR